MQGWLCASSIGASERLHTDLKIALPGLEEDQRREARLRPYRLWRDGLHRPSHRRISGDVLARRGLVRFGSSWEVLFRRLMTMAPHVTASGRALEKNRPGMSES